MQMGRFLFPLAAVHGPCTASTCTLYYEYMAFLLGVQKPCTASGPAEIYQKTASAGKKYHPTAAGFQSFSLTLSSSYIEVRMHLDMKKK
jgi:hypothetical protein